MKTLIIGVITALILTVSPGLALAKEKLYIINSGSTNGTFNAILSTYAKDLGDLYDVQYVQSKGCTKTHVILNKIGDAKVFYIVQGITAATSSKCEDAVFQPGKHNVITSDIKFGMIFARVDGASVKELTTGDKSIGYNGVVNKKWLEKLDIGLSVKNKHVKYDNSTGVVLAVLNGEVDLGLVNSTKKVWQHKGKLVGLLSLNPKGDSGVPPLNGVVKFNGNEKGQVDNFFVQGFSEQELIKFRQIIANLHNSESTVSAWYNKAIGYTNTATWTRKDAVKAAEHYVNIWRD